MGLLDPPALTPNAAAAKYAYSALGVYVPAGWGTYWRARRTAAAAGTALAKIAVYGDSIGHSYASDLDEKTYPGCIATSLQAKYGNGGGGFFGVGYCSVGLAFTGSSWTTDDNKFVRVTGTWAAGPSDGPGQRMISSVVDGSTATKRVRGTTVGIWTAVASSGMGAFTVTVDGGAPVTVNTTPSWSTTNSAFQKVTIATGLTNAYHTIVVTKSGTTVAYLNGFWGENASGVLVDNYSAYGALSTNVAGGGFGTVAELGKPVPNCGGKYNSSDVFIYAMAANDANAGNTAPDTYAANVITALNQVRRAGTATSPTWSIDKNGATDIILFQPHLGNFDAQSPPLGHQFTARMRGIADHYCAALVNANAVGRNSYAYALSQNWWGTVLGATPGGAGSDSVHMSDVGMQAYADLLLKVIDS